MNNRFRGYRLLSLLLIAASATACARTSTPAENPVSTQSASPVTSQMVVYENDDADSAGQQGNPTYVELTGDSATVTGTGAAVSGTKIMVLSSGEYVISGRLGNGQIVVDSQTKGTVRLVFNGVEIHSNDNAPVYVKNADKTIITLQDGTQNLVSDTQNYVYVSAEDQPNAAIFSKDDLTINGTGTLTVHGNYNNGIMGKDDLKITGGTIVVHAVDDGIVGQDMVAVKEGTITIEAGGDGIKSTNDTDPSKGVIALKGGRFDIKSGGDG